MAIKIDKLHELFSARPAARSGGPWLASVRYLPATLPVALLTLKIKYSIVTLVATLVLSRSLGRVANDGLGAWEKMSLFSSDLWFGFFLLPLCSLVILRPLRPGCRALFTAGLNVLLFLLLFATWQCYLQTGRYYSSATLLDSIMWTWHNPDFLGQFVPLSAQVQIAAAVLFIAGTALFAYRSERSGSGGRNSLACAVASYSVAAFAAAAGLSLAPGIPQTPYHQSIMASATGAFWGIGRDALPIGEFAGLGPEELLQRYRELAHAPAPVRNPQFWGKARGCNVLFFIFETAPARILDLSGDLRDLPALARLREKAFVATAHHTTYPYTNRAWFSILTSLYPSSLVNDPAQKPGMSFPGIMRALGRDGYVTKVYFTPFQNDGNMFESLGVGEQFLQMRDEQEEKSGARDELRAKIADDLSGIRALRNDIRRWSREDASFCAAIGPQIGHAPWPPLAKSGPDDIVSRGRAVIRLQDAWLGEVIAALEEQRQLEKTIIIVTGDHGVRIRQEDPSFQGGMIDDYSFHVPLLIYAPQALRATRKIPWLTSHIDIAPTVLDLLGRTGGRGFEQGSPLWDERLQRRTTYFFANHYLGADGYASEGAYYMLNHVSETVYRNTRLTFALTDLVPADAPEHPGVVRAINRMSALQQLLGERVAERRFGLSRVEQGTPGRAGS